MPKIKTWETFVEGARYRVDISVDSKGVFSTEVPMVYREILGYGVVQARTLEECERKLGSAMKEAKERQTTVNKVIAFQFRTTAYIMRKGVCILNQDDISFSSGISCSLWCGVYNEHVIAVPGGKVDIIYKYEESSIPKSSSNGERSLVGNRFNARPARVVDWTREQEDFFARMTTGIENICLMMEKLNDPAKVLELANSPSAFKLLGAAV